MRAHLHISTDFLEGVNGSGRQTAILSEAAAVLGRTMPQPDIQTELLEMPALLADVGLVVAAATFKKTQAKQALDATVAQTSERVLHERISSGGKTTDAAIKSATDASPEVIAAERKIAQIEYERSQLQTVFNALEARKSALLAISGLTANSH